MKPSLLFVLLLLPLQTNAQDSEATLLYQVVQAQVSRTQMATVREHGIFSQALKPSEDNMVAANEGFILYASQEEAPDCSDRETVCVVTARADFKTDPPRALETLIRYVPGDISLHSCSCATNQSDVFTVSDECLLEFDDNDRSYFPNLLGG